MSTGVSAKVTELAEGPNADLAARLVETNQRPQKLFNAILEWNLQNPYGNMEECALTVGVRLESVHMIVASDMFQARLAQARESGYDVALQSLREKLNGIASYGLDRLAERIALESDTDKIRSIVDMALKRLNYGEPDGGRPGVVQNNFLVANPDQMKHARNILTRLRNHLPPMTQHSDDNRSIDSTAEVIPASG